MDETLLGFQLRSSLDRVAPWSQARRAQYLLVDQIDSPLSVDKAVWSSSDDRSLLSKLFIDYFGKDNAAPNGLNIYSVKDISALTKSSRFETSMLIGITAVGDCGAVLKEKHKVKESTVSLEQIRLNRWKCLGYDVADHWLRSGLMNCGYSSLQKSELLKTFGPKLNKYGLFDSTDIAETFRADCNTRIPEHAPFCVFGIWLHE